VITICIGASSEEAREVARKAQANVVVLLDADGETAHTYQIRATPTTYLIDPEGVIQWSQVGYGRGSEKELRKAIVRLLAE